MIDKETKARRASFALTPMLTLGKAKLELMHGALALTKDGDAESCMRHAFAALEVLKGLTDDIERLARECEFVAHGDSKAFQRIYHGDRFGQTFLRNWQQRFKRADELKAQRQA